jgi:hypothetical protein
VAAYEWDDLRALTLSRQFPEVVGVDPKAVVEAVRRIGPIQSQTARSPYVALGARLPGVAHDTVSAAHEAWELVRGSTIRGTVHTSSADQHPLLDATTRVGQRAIWARHLSLGHSEVEELWRATEDFAADTWRTPEELVEHLRGWLGERSRVVPREIDRSLERYLGFGHGGLIRRPLRGGWSGQGAAGYRTARTLLPGRPPAGDPLLQVVRLHLSSYGPATRRDVAWWSGLGLRQVDALLEQLAAVWHEGPDGAAYADVPGMPPPRDLTGVRLLPEFDAVLCGYDPRARHRFVAPTDHASLWSPGNGFMRAPLLLDGRVGGHWRIEGTGADRTLAVTVLAGSRKPRKADLDEPSTALGAALGVRLIDVSISRATS